MSLIIMLRLKMLNVCSVSMDWPSLAVHRIESELEHLVD